VSAAKRVAHAAETIRARWERDVASDPQTEAAQALEDTCQLLDPEVAAELESLRAQVAELRAERADRQDDVAAAVGYTSGLEWSDLVSVVASNTTSLVQAERDVRALRAQAAEQLRANRDRIAELEVELRIGAPWKCHVCGKDNQRDICVICETYRADSAAAEAGGAS
jgi:hypothetical protein